MTDAPATLNMTDDLEEVLCLVGHDQAGRIGPEQAGALDELYTAGLVTYRDPDWSLTASGRKAFDRLLLD
jgi:hypothetical protein